MSDQLLGKYCSLFLHNTSQYIISLSGNWITENREVTPALIQKHLEHKITIGLSPVKEDNTLKWVAYDFDAHNDEPMKELKENVIKTRENLAKVGIDSHIEKSGRGYHLWVFFEEPIAREKIENFLKQFAYHSLEIYAGKTKIRIPLGAYQKDRSIFCGFLDKSFNLIQNQQEYLMNIKPTLLQTIQNAKQYLQSFKLTTKPISQNKKRRIIGEQKWMYFDKEKKEKVISEIKPKELLKVTKNTKHKLILHLLDKMNLSPREIIRLNVKDVNIHEQILRIRKFKEVKRKVLLIPGHLLNLFKAFTEKKNPDEPLVKSERNKRYNKRTIQMIKENAFKKANLAPESDDN